MVGGVPRVATMYFNRSKLFIDPKSPVDPRNAASPTKYILMKKVRFFLKNCFVVTLMAQLLQTQGPVVLPLLYFYKIQMNVMTRVSLRVWEPITLLNSLL
jgi:hypothetical protein